MTYPLNRGVGRKLFGTGLLLGTDTCHGGLPGRVQEGRRTMWHRLADSHGSLTTSTTQARH